ncbi:MAG: DUF429 domain-containing protein, partial [Chloroflexi bacterium]|nr:DUF429 domain-containing protein [Chloroflexota bacterium]
GAGKADEVIDLIGKQDEVMCAVDAPRMPNIGRMADADTRSRFDLPTNTATWSQYRVCEYELRRRNIKLYNTPPEVESAPTWMKAGWKFYDDLRQIGFESYPSSSKRQFFEVHPHAIFTVFLGRVPYLKDTLEGRLQRQLLLYDEGLNIPDAMNWFEEVTRTHILRGAIRYNGVRTHDELDALASALTAYYAHTKPKQITLVGDVEDGQIVVPTAELKEKYE